MEEKLLAVVLPLITPVVALVLLLLFVPEKLEKWSALLWKLLGHVGGLFRGAHKRYVQHDLQGRVNDFVRRLSKQVPGSAWQKLKIEWVDPATDRGSFLRNDVAVIRLKRDDPDDANFVHGALLFVSQALLQKTKRYLSQSQREAVDLYVCSKLFQEEKPAVVAVFLDDYLHPKTGDPKSKTSLYIDDFAHIERGGLFFPVLLQELQFLGDKVFGRRKDEHIITEVNSLIGFLKPIANRVIGDEGDLNFRGSYCRVGLVIIGKPSKLLTSIEPYVTYIRTHLMAEGAETIYLLARAENQAHVDAICERFAESYECVRDFSFRKRLRYSDREELAHQYLVVLRRKGLELVRASEQPPAETGRARGAPSNNSFQRTPPARSRRRRR